MCKTVHEHLHCVVDLYCDLGPIGLLLWLMAGPNVYLSPLLHPPGLLYVQLVIIIIIITFTSSALKGVHKRQSLYKVFTCNQGNV